MRDDLSSTHDLPASKSGRPRQFDRAAALHAALELFWRQGYGATSLDDLNSGMGISRSSFYGSFGSKHAVLMEVLELYTGDLLDQMNAAVSSDADPKAALLAVLEIIACTRDPSSGCLFVNSVNELLPADKAVADLAQRYLSKVDQTVVGLLQRLDFPTDELRGRSGALLALATGAITLRKAGQSYTQIRVTLDRLSMLLA